MPGRCTTCAGSSREQYASGISNVERLLGGRGQEGVSFHVFMELPEWWWWDKLETRGGENEEGK